jgi:1,4-alpha-glucan branching enzyme
MIKQEAIPASDRVLVTFEYAAAVRAASVHLVGDFNDWNETSLPLKFNARRSVWTVQIELERERDYQFRYLVDGASWHNDWHASRYVPNIYDSDNSVVST